MKMLAEEKDQLFAVVLITIGMVLLVAAVCELGSYWVGTRAFPTSHFDGKRDRAEVLIDADRQVALQKCQRAYARKFKGVPPGTYREHEDCRSAVYEAGQLQLLRGF